MSEQERRFAVYNDRLGLMPCTVVGRNAEFYLVRVEGRTVPVERSAVFELEPGWEIGKGGKPTSAAAEGGVGVFAPDGKREEEDG